MRTGQQLNTNVLSICLTLSPGKQDEIKTPTHIVFLISLVILAYFDSILTHNLSFFSFRFLNKANLYQLQQPCNLKDSVSCPNSGFAPWWKEKKKHAVGFHMICEIKWMYHCTGEDHRSIAQRCDVMRRDHKDVQGWTKQGTRTDNSIIVRFHLLSASQEYTHTKKRKIFAWQRPGDWRMELSFWVFTFQLCPLSKTSLSSWAALTETELKPRICSGVINVVCQFWKL